MALPREFLKRLPAAREDDNVDAVGHLAALSTCAKEATSVNVPFVQLPMMTW